MDCMTCTHGVAQHKEGSMQFPACPRFKRDGITAFSCSCGTSYLQGAHPTTHPQSRLCSFQSFQSIEPGPQVCLKSESAIGWLGAASAWTLAAPLNTSERKKQNPALRVFRSCVLATCVMSSLASSAISSFAAITASAQHSARHLA